MQRHALLVVLLWVSALPLPAVTVNLNALADATLFEDASGSLAGGGGDYLFAGATLRNGLRRSVLTFDLSSLPAGAVVTSATLTLTLSKSISGDETLSLLRALSPWSEGATDPAGEEGGGTSAAPGDVTWLHTSYTNSTWSAAGGDFDAFASASATVGSGPGAYSWTGSNLATDVQGWIDNPASNFGWFLVGNESSPGSAKRFNSRSNADAATVPVLTVTYSLIPEPGTLSLLALAAAAATAGRRCRSQRQR